MSRRELENQLVEEAQTKGPLGKAAIYARLSGPGWMQGAITLGGGSLGGALYLGVIAGFGMMWLQPLAMICGIIMLAAIAYVTLSTEQRPFGAINQHLSPLLGWSWLIATVMANIVWCMPQFGLGTAAIQQNLFPGIGDGKGSTIAICAVLFIVAFGVNLLYESDGRGMKIFDWIIKILVGLIVISFFAVVITLSTNGALDWGLILSGLVPDFTLLSKPSASFSEFIAASSNPEWWTAHIVKDQRDIIVTAFATAVGINMTWLLPYSLLKKSWGKKHRGLAIFDLSIGLFIPFFLATSCVVIAAASQFHAKTDDVEPGSGVKTISALEASYEVSGAPALPINDTDRRIADMLVKRNNFQLATTLEPLAGKVVSQKIFGFGVLGMAASTIIILMLMNGLAFQELFGKPNNKTVHLTGCAVSGLAGTLGPFIWTGPAKLALAIPTSVIGGCLIPIAYFTFLLLMNSKKVLGENRPTGGRRVLWNTLMIFATSIATYGAFWVLKGKTSNHTPVLGSIEISHFAYVGGAFLILLFVVGTVSFIKNERRA